MSSVLRKRQKLSEDLVVNTVYSKDSFERFGDDLSEVLLSYLSFEDKFRFECVSKQFQRLVFNKVDAIYMNVPHISTLFGPFHFQKRVNIKIFESVLKKCPNIRKILSSENAINEEEVFEAIIKYCNQLNEIESDFANLIETVDRFCTKFGPKLKKINFIPNKSTVQKLLKTCPNLEIMAYNWLSFDDYFDGNQLMVNRLKSFLFYFFPEDTQRIPIFMKSNRNTLKSLEIIINDKTLTTFHTNILFEELSDLIHLKSLGIYYYVSTDKSFVDFVGKFREKYPKLLKVNFELKLDNSSDILKVFKSLNGIKELKTIVLKNRIEGIPLIPIISEWLKDSKNLRNLSIVGNTFRITDEFFVSIDKNLSKLSNLHLFNADISGQALSLLSKLSYLRSISLISESLESLISESDVFDFIKKSRKIDSIYLINSGFSCDFTQIDIEKFKEQSNRHNSTTSAKC